MGLLTSGTAPLLPSHQRARRDLQHVFGEQVANGNANMVRPCTGRPEGVGYVTGLVPFTSAGIGAPYIRERAYWVAESRWRAMSKLLPGLAGRCICGRGSRLVASKPTGLRSALAARTTPTSRDWKDTSGMTQRSGTGRERLDQLPPRAFLTGSQYHGQSTSQCNDGANDADGRGDTEQKSDGRRACAGARP